VIYATNEPVQLEDQGVAVNLINVSDVVDLVSNGIVVSEDAMQNHPDLVRALDAAFAEALQYTIDHPDEAYEMSKKYVEGLSDSSVEPTQRKVLTRSIEFWKAPKLGQSDTASWIAMDDILRSMGLLPDQADTQKAFTNEFLP
jgi:NitT/TauT family transport system substrate-binding protein